MVRALLDGRKTQTRRVLASGAAEDIGIVMAENPPRFAVGDRLYVREAWRTESRAYDDLAPSDMGGEETVIYEADAEWSLNKSVGRLRAGMHMPRWASRLTLTVTDLRVQRVQDIDYDDAVAEGVSSDNGPGQIGAYITLWDKLNAARSFGWETNPWIVAVSFTVQRGNIDQVAA